MPAKPKPGPLGEEFGRQFTDPSVVAAYHLRPPYPAATFDVLLELLGGHPSRVLDVGCGTGDVARPLSSRVDEVHAVDASERMLAKGRGLPGGSAPGLTWIHARVEDAPLQPPYGLVTCGESLHWMDWDIVLPRFEQVLDSGANVVMVGRPSARTPWSEAGWAVAVRYATNVASSSYDLVAELRDRGLFEELGSRETQPVSFRQSVDEFIESYHSRNGLSRDRLTPEAAAAFDADLRAVVAPHCPDNVVELQVSGRLTWGLPRHPG